jgi:hypothetical protein
MKKSFLMMAFAALFILSNSVVWAETKPCPQCWVKLKARGIKSVKVTPIPGKNIMKVHMKNIKQALERAGINEPVSIFLSIGNKNLGSLGSFTPSVRDDGEHGDGAANRSNFTSIPRTKNIKVTRGLFHAIQQKTKATTARSSSLARPARPARPATVARPARPARPASVYRPARPARPATVARPARPARPAAPVGKMRTKTSQQNRGLLTFRNSKGQVMVYLQVRIVGM